MEAKEAVRAAKAHIADLFADEAIENVGLEEVVFCDGDPSGEWRVTVGFSRLWNHKNPLIAALGDRRLGRSYKVVRVSDGDGRIASVTDISLSDSRI